MAAYGYSGVVETAWGGNGVEVEALGVTSVSFNFSRSTVDATTNDDNGVVNNMYGKLDLSVDVAGKSQGLSGSGILNIINAEKNKTILPATITDGYGSTVKANMIVNSFSTSAASDGLWEYSFGMVLASGAVSVTVS